MILYMYIAPGLGDEILMSTGTSCYFGHLKSDFIQFFFVILYMYIAPGQGQTAPGDKILMSTEMSCHFIHLSQV